jgi:hypothetical protein
MTCRCALGAGIVDGWPKGWILSSGKCKIVSPFHVIRAGSEAHSASSLVGTWGFFPNGKAAKACS